ncbi:MAG: hypothetical protein DKT66_22375 [Candidatus Melainabacteria bacterium]|nr:MAG: hypothetical protein DKT66_22375 [Candidatus Melainabacteria bacterium]
MNAKVLLAAFSVSILGCAVVPAMADTETIIRTTTITQPVESSSSTEFVLSGSGNYAVVDPLTGAIKGPYDPIRGYVSGSVNPGWVILDRSNNRVLATFNSSGRLVALSRVPAFDPYVATIDSRRSDLERYINESLSLGKISADQAMHLRSELATIAAQEEGYRVGGRSMTYDEALLIAARLNDLHTTLAGYVPTITLRRLVGTTYITSDGTVVSPATTAVVPTRTVIAPATTVIGATPVVIGSDDISGRIALMTQKIDDEYKAGRVTNRSVARLKERLNEVSTKQVKYTKNGILSESKHKYLSEKLDDIQTSFDNDIASTQRARARIGIRVN